MIATGELHSVKNICEIAFTHIGLNYQDYLHTDERFFRPKEVVPLVGDSSLARETLQWKPKVMFTDLIKMMVDSDIEFLNRKLGNY